MPAGATPLAYTALEFLLYIQRAAHRGMGIGRLQPGQERSVTSTTRFPV